MDDITISPTDEIDEISETDSFISIASTSWSFSSISPTDEIPETESSIYNPSFASNETSIPSYKTERSINSRKSRYNALPRRKYASTGLPNGHVSSGVDVPKVVSGQRPGGSIPYDDDGTPESQAAVHNAILIDSEAGADARRRLGAELKLRVTTLVEYMYNFETGRAPASIIYNTSRAQELLRDMNFIHPEPRTGRDPYRHPIIQRVINTNWFRDTDDIGVVDHKPFSPMPIPLIAITLTVIEWCIVEWSGGTRRDFNWDGAKFQTVYDSHVSSLREFPTHSSASLYQLQCDLLRNAREHAGVIECTNDPRVNKEDIILEARVERLQRNEGELVKENAALTSLGNLKLVKERKTSATEINEGLESKRDSLRPLQAREYSESFSTSGPPLDASGVLMWRPLNFLAGQRPSAQEERGDGRLVHAHQLARDNQGVISPSDSEIVRERIVLAHEMKMRLDSMRGLPRYLQAREYRKAAKETLQFVKRIPDRARDLTLNSAFPGHDTVISVNRPRGLVSHVDAVPLQAKAQNPISIDSEESYSDPRIRVINIRKQLAAEMKPEVTILVEDMYNFKTSHWQLEAHEPRTGYDPYRHPIIQRIIDTTWFRDKDDIGVVDHEHFSPMPIPIIALTLMVIECCIDEWSSGTRMDSSWDDAQLQTVYESHVASLLDFQAHSPARNRDLLYQLQCDLLRNARKYAGVSPDPLTGSSRITLEALDAVCEEVNQPGPNTPPGGGDDEIHNRFRLTRLFLTSIS